jgi:hypothetical protein
MTSELKEGLKDITAGFVGGFLQCAVGHPFDTVKVFYNFYFWFYYVFSKLNICRNFK